jgi:uncharacterized SAM-binding protein YcdF (DUF218 family)
MFFFKKLISAFLLPLPFCLGLMAVGLFLLWFTKRQRLGRGIVTGGFVLLTLLSYRFVAQALMEPLENDHAAVLVAAQKSSEPPGVRQARWIVVLGAGHVTLPEWPPTSQLNPSALARISEGVRLHRLIPGAKLLVSGGIGPVGMRQADILARVATIMGVPPSDIVADDRSRDTEEEAYHLKQHLRGDRFVLITSAAHLPRAVALFRKQGLDPIPAPADPWARDMPGVALNDLFPGSGALHIVESATHEYLGTLWSKLRGRL